MLLAQAHSFAAQARLAITLSWVAGYTNLLCLLIVAHPTSHVTGTASLLGQIAVEPHRLPLVWPLLIIIISFALGAAFSGLLTETGRNRGWDSIYVLPIAAQSLLLVVVALAIEFSARSPLQEGTAYWLILTCAPAAMGLQNSTITRISAGVVRTTHVTGVLTDLGTESALLLMHTLPARAGAPRRRRDADLSARRLALLLSIFGSFVFGSALAALAFDHARWLAVYPPVLFLLWIIYTDSTRPIAEIEHLGPGHLPPAMALYHVRPDRRRKGNGHRLPNLLSWADRLDPRVRVVVLDLDHVAQLDDNAALELRAVIDHLKDSGRQLVLAGITPGQYQQLHRLDILNRLPPFCVYEDCDLAIARALTLLD